MGIRITGDEGLALAVFRIDGAVDAADVAAVHVDADRGAIVKGVVHAVDVANARGNALHSAGLQADGGAVRLGFALCVELERLRVFSAAQHADQAPRGVVVNGCALTRAPDKADDGKALARIGMQQELLEVLGVRLRVFSG